MGWVCVHRKLGVVKLSLAFQRRRSGIGPDDSTQDHVCPYDWCTCGYVILTMSFVTVKIRSIASRDIRVEGINERIQYLTLTAPMYATCRCARSRRSCLPSIEELQTSLHVIQSRVHTSSTARTTHTLTLFASIQAQLPLTCTAFRGEHNIVDPRVIAEYAH
jgi:hypothetical protein